MNIVLKSATIIDSKSIYNASVKDILIENGTIRKIDDSIQTPKNCTEIRLKNLHVSVGWFDQSVSFGEPGFEDRETLNNGLQTAAKSGYTNIALNPNTSPAPDTKSGITYILNKANLHAVNLHPIGRLTKGNSESDLAELYDMQQEGAVAFYNYKNPIIDPNLLKIALQYASNFNGLIWSYPQNKFIARNGVVNEHEASMNTGLKGIPNVAESLQLSRDLHLLKYTGGKLHVPTISTAESVNLIREAKAEGLDVSCSVAIHNLWFTDDRIKTFDSNFKVLPPLRTERDIKALKNGITDGTIDFITADHCPITIEQKNVEFDQAEFGTIGLESSFGALNTIFTTEEAIRLLTKSYAVFNMETPQIKVGEQANLTLFKPEENYTFSESDINSTSKNSIFLNAALTGKAYGIYANSELILNDN